MNEIRGLGCTPAVVPYQGIRDNCGLATVSMAMAYL